VDLAAKTMFFYATGITPAMTMKKVGESSPHAGAFVDAKGHRCDGSNTHRSHMLVAPRKNTLLPLYGPREPWFDKKRRPGESSRLEDQSQGTPKLLLMTPGGHLGQ